MNDENNDSCVMPSPVTPTGLKLSTYPRVGVLGKDDLVMVSVRLRDGGYSTAAVTLANLASSLRDLQDVTRYEDGNWNREG